LNRAFTLSDPALIKRLRTEFVPVTGDTHELQDRPSPASKWFMRLVNQTRPGKDPNTTTQGFYTAPSDGTGYGWVNTHDPARLHAFLDAALEKFGEEAPPSAARTDTDDAAATAPFAKTPDPTTSVIRVFSRIRPLPEGAHVLNTSVGRDHLWIYADEIRQMLAASAEDRETPFPLRPSLTARLTRFHLIDNVRGEPDMWEADRVKEADFVLRRVADSATTRTFALTGTFAQELPGGERGQHGTIEGEFTADKESATITHFRAYSEGEAWGRSTYTQHAPPGRFPLVIAMVETNDAVSRIVPPQALAWWVNYRDPRQGDHSCVY
jgi:hypothetical protein